MGSVDFPNRRFDASRRVELNGMIDALSKSNCPIKIAASAYKIKFGDSAMPEYILHKTQWNSKGASKSIEELSVRKKTFSQQDILLRCLRMFAQYSKRKDAGSSSNKNQSRCCSVAGFVSYHDVTLILQRVQKDLGINLLAGSNIRKLFERKGWSNRRYLSYNEFLETCSCLLDITHEQVKREKNLTKLSTNQLLIKNQTISKNVEHEEAGHCNFGLPARRNGVASTNLNKKEGKDETTLFHQVPCGMSLPFSMAQWKSKSASFFDYSLEGSMPPRPKTAPNRVSTHHSTWPRIEYVKSFEVELESGVGVLNAETSNAKKNSSPQKRKHQYHTKEKKIQITSYKTNKEGDKVCCNAHNSCKKGSKKSGFVEESFSGTINSLSKEIIDDCTKNEKTIYDDSMKETVRKRKHDRYNAEAKQKVQAEKNVTQKKQNAIQLKLELDHAAQFSKERCRVESLRQKRIERERQRPWILSGAWRDSQQYNGHHNGKRSHLFPDRSKSIFRFDNNNKDNVKFSLGDLRQLQIDKNKIAGEMRCMTAS